MASTSDDAVQLYLATQWPDGLKCPLCGATDWFTTPEGPHALEGMPMAVSLYEEPGAWAPPVGVWLVICSSCGFVAPLLDEFVTAEQKDLTSEDEPDILT